MNVLEEYDDEISWICGKGDKWTKPFEFHNENRNIKNSFRISRWSNWKRSLDAFQCKNLKNYWENSQISNSLHLHKDSEIEIDENCVPDKNFLME